MGYTAGSLEDYVGYTVDCTPFRIYSSGCQDCAVSKGNDTGRYRYRYYQVQEEEDGRVGV